MNIIKRLFGGRIEGQVKDAVSSATGIPTTKKGIISEGKRIASIMIAMTIVGVAAHRGYTVPEEAAQSFAVAFMALTDAAITLWSKVTKP